MHIQFLTPLMTSVTMSMVCALAAHSQHKSTDEEDIFSIGPAIAWFMVGGGIFLSAVPFWPGASGDLSRLGFFWRFSPFWGGAFLAALYFFNYRVIVRDSTLTVGAFWRRVIPFSEVIDYDEVQGNRSSELWVYLKNGKRLRLSGMLGDFGDLVGLVNSHMEGLPGPHHDSAAKLQDRAARVRNNRQGNWYTGIGILVVVIFVLFLKKKGWM